MRSGPVLALAALLAFAAGDSLAQPQSPASDAPVATASGGAPGTAEQIKAFIDSSPAAKRRPGLRDFDDDLPLPDRKVHGEVSVGVGNHGYRSAYARSDIPLGKRGSLSIAVGEERGRGFDYGYPYEGYGGHGMRPAHGD